jgi:hypothetical protein
MEMILFVCHVFHGNVRTTHAALPLQRYKKLPWKALKFKQIDG